MASIGKRGGIAASCLLLFAACSRCNGGDATTPASDAGDSAVVEASADTGPSVDSAPADTPGDGGAISDWPGWRRMKDVGDCQFDVPVDLAATAPKWSWVPCSNGAPSCEEFVTTWPPSKTYVNPVYFDGLFSGITAEGEAPLLRVGRLFDAPDEKSKLWDEIVYDVDKGEAVAAYRAYDTPVPPEGCRLSAIPGRGGLTLLSQVPTVGLRYARWMPGDSLERTWTTLAPFDTIPYQQSMATSATSLAWDRGGTDQVIRAAIGSSKYSIFYSAGDRGHTLRFVLGDDVFTSWYYGTAGWSQFYRIDPAGNEILYRGVTGRHVRAMASDGKWMFWAEEFGGTDPRYPNQSEIFVAPYTPDPAVLAATAKKIASLAHPISGLLRAWDGVVRVFDDTERSLLIRYDGATQYINGSPGLGLADPGMIRGGKYYTLTAMKNDAGGYPRGTGFARFTLGAWTPPP